MRENIYLIYQLRNLTATRDYRFRTYQDLINAGLSVDKENYNYIYKGVLDEDTTLDSIFEQFNLNQPCDFIGHTLSVSDIVVIHKNGKATAHYVNDIGFVDVPEFLKAPYKYYSTQRPISIGTFPKENSPIRIVNFDRREWVEDTMFQAWGFITYDAPLTQQQVQDYELRAAQDNPDDVHISPYQVDGDSHGTQ